MKISEILIRTAEQYGKGHDTSMSWDSFLCHCIADTMGVPRNRVKSNEKTRDTMRFLSSFGMPLDGSGFTRWHSSSIALSAEEKWGVRYAWLELMIQVAEEEGL